MLEEPGKDDVSALELFKIFRQRLRLTLLLSLAIITSIILESIGFGMILPVLETLVGSDSGSRLGDLFKQAFDFVGMEMTLLNVTIAFAVIMLVKNLAIVMREALRSYFAYSFKRDAMLGINKSLFDMSFDEFLQERQGHIINDTTTETHKATLVLLQFIEFVTSIIAVLAFISVMLLAEPLVTVCLIGIGAVFMGGSKYALNGYSKKVGLKEVELNQSVTDYVAESVTLMRDFRLYLLEKFQLKRMARSLNRLLHLLVRWDAITAAIAPMIEMIIIISFTAYIVYITSSGNDGQFLEKLPAIGVILVLSHRMLQRVSRLSITHLSITKYLASYVAVSKYLNVQEREDSGQQGVNYLGDILFKDITVLAKDGKEILHNETICIPGKKITAIVGETGSGKSTLIDLLSCLRRPESGEIRIGSNRVDDMDKVELRSHISVISQTTMLRNDTVMSNIKTGNLDAKDEAVYQVTRALGIHDFIESLPQGYNTMVGDRGSLLSGGQVQRITIARALLRNPDILIMDEATSALDANTESIINRNVMEWMKGKTVIVITHRSSVLDYCDQVYAIQDGKIELQS